MSVTAGATLFITSLNHGSWSWLHLFTGWVLNVIHEDGEHLELEYTMHWTPRPGAQVPERDWQGAITRAVEHTREMAEGRDA